MRWADITTLRVGGEITDYRPVTTEAELIAEVSACDAANRNVVVVAGGSNIIASDEPMDITAVHILSSGTSLSRDACSGGMVAVQAGHSWDAFVAQMIEFGFSGVEMLSGIPGSVGATPIQNVGAYGQQVSDSLARVRVFDRYDRAIRTFAVADCGFGYRTSRFKQEADRYLILEVTFQLKNATLSEPIRYPEVAGHLNVDLEARVPLADARRAVLALRRAKGMVLDDNDHDTWSAGSFFLNPVLSAAQASALPSQAPQWLQTDGSVKVPAAWLIEAAGLSRGQSVGDAAISTKHTLALTNRGAAKASDLVALAQEIQSAVRQQFDIVLQPEVRLLGLSLSQ